MLTVVGFFFAILIAVFSATVTSAASPDEVVLYDFRADYCAPCRAMDPIVHQPKEEGFSIRVVDIEDEPEMAEQISRQANSMLAVTVTVRSFTSRWQGIS